MHIKIVIIILMITLLHAPERYKSIIEKYAEKYGVETILIKAIGQQESRWEKGKSRYESHLTNAEWYLALLTEKEKQNKLAFSSCGELQILYGIAKSIGYNGTPEQLLESEKAIEYGIKYLSILISKHYYLNKVIIIYNKGHYKNQYTNWLYMRKVKKYYKAYGGKIK